jgi:hypothetical protein
VRILLFKTSSSSSTPTKDVITDLPAGLVGNPQATPTCPSADFLPDHLFLPSHCPSDSQVGVAVTSIGSGPGFQLPGFEQPIFNLAPPKGVLARIGFLAGPPVVVDISLRAAGDYSLVATAHSLSSAANIYWTRIDLWGVPADSSHDQQRWITSSFAKGVPSGQPRRPFLTNPMHCGVALTTGLSVDSWQEPGSVLSYTSAPMSFEGCGALHFEPSIEAAARTGTADSPSGFDFRLHIPQENELAQDEIQSLEVRATEGQLKLSFDGAQTGDISSGASAGEVRQELETLPTIGPGDVAVAGGPADAGGTAPYSIVFRGTLARTDVEEMQVEGGAEPLRITTAAGTAPGSATLTTRTPGTPAGTGGSELATAELRDAVVRLPEGVVVNPAAAGVQEACSLAQVGMSATGVANEDPVTCPDASVLGDASVVSPALDHPLPGRIYLAQQDKNPFHSLLAMYLVIDDPISGTLIKLPGRIVADPLTGQLTTSFRGNPQLPVEDLELHLLGGDNAPLRTPLTCGAKTTTSDLVPWTAPEGETTHPSASFSITQGCAASEATAPNSPSFEAGTTGRAAGAYSPFVLTLARQDGSQQLAGLEATLPPGLLAKLAGVPYCSDRALMTAAAKTGREEQASSSCPAASQVGAAWVGVGAGPNPYYAAGSAYLAGPYKGAPLSLAVVTPAVAGPFDLGTVVVRNALQVDPITAQVHAVSDPFPQIRRTRPAANRSRSPEQPRP